MLQLFVQGVQNALPLALTIAILLANRAYAPRERRTVSRVTWAISLLGLGAAALVAYLRLRTTYINVPAFNSAVGPVAVLALTTFLVGVWVFGARDLHDQTQGPRHRFLTAAALVALGVSALYFGFPYFFSTDGIVLMGASLFDTDSLLRLAGFVLGTALVVVVSWGYVVSAARVPWYVRSGITTAVFGAIIVPQAILLYQQLANWGYVPRSSLVFTWVLWIQNHQAATQIALAALISLPGIVALWTHPSVPADANPAQKRIRKADQISRREFMGLSVLGSAVFLATLTVGKRMADFVPELSALEPATVKGDKVAVSRSLVDDGHLHRFAFQASDATEVRFLAIKKNDVAYGTGLDACEICGPSGYYEDKGKVICRECGVMMNIQTIGFPGGCNPIPIAYEVVGSEILFSAAELESHAAVFRR